MSAILINDELQATLPALDELSRLLHASDLNGAEGLNRERIESCQLVASNDLEAIHAWLAEYHDSPATYRTYRKEAERFLLWCIYQKRKALSSTLRSDIEEYANFLNDPQPRHIWCQPRSGRGYKRGSENWKPFTGGLSASAKATALSSLNSLFSYLTAGRYLNFNPFSIIRNRMKNKVKVAEDYFRTQERILAPDEWQAMLETMESYPEATLEEKREKERLRFLVSIMFFLGLRINELVTHSWSAFRKHNDLWWFYLIGKGGKPARIPVNDDLLRAVIQYRLFLNKPPLPLTDENAALIPSLQNGEAITARQVNIIIKKLATVTARKFMHAPEKEKKLLKFSAHWFRHLSASMQDRIGSRYIRQNLRHENEGTTRRYIHADDEDRHSEMQKLKLDSLFN